MHLRISPPVVTAIIVLVMWGINHVFDAGRITSSLQAPVPISFLVTGVVLMAAAVASFVAAKTTINPLKPSRTSKLVTSGVFGFSRNPIYLGDLLIVTAVAVWLGQIANIALLVAFVWYIDRFQIRPEERALSTLFGGEYYTYCARVRRWL